MNIFIDKNCTFTTRSTGKLKLKFWVQQLQNNNILSFSKKKGGTRSPRLFPYITEYTFTSFGIAIRNSVRDPDTVDIYSD